MNKTLQSSLHPLISIFKRFCCLRWFWQRKAGSLEPFWSYVCFRNSRLFDSLIKCLYIRFRSLISSMSLVASKITTPQNQPNVYKNNQMANALFWAWTPRQLMLIIMIYAPARWLILEKRPKNSFGISIKGGASQDFWGPLHAPLKSLKLGAVLASFLKAPRAPWPTYSQIANSHTMHHLSCSFASFARGVSFDFGGSNLGVKIK